MKMPYTSRKKVVSSLQKDQFLTVGLSLLRTYQSQVLQILTTYRVQLALSLAVLSIVACLGLFYLFFSTRARIMGIRGVLVGLKAHPWLEVTQSTPYNLPASILERIDGFVMGCGLLA